MCQDVSLAFVGGSSGDDSWASSLILKKEKENKIEKQKKTPIEMTEFIKTELSSNY